jgi:hypothetical protein
LKFRYKDEVWNLNDLQIEERFIYPNDRDRYYLIGAFHQSSIIGKNDKYITELQNHEILDEELITDLRKAISKNKGKDVDMYL